MKITSTEKTLFLIYLCLTIIVVIIHTRMVDIPNEDYRMKVHELVISKTAPSPIQYRVLPVYFSELLQKTGISFRASYILIRGIFTFLSAFLLHLFLKKWFKTETVLIGLLFFFSILPLTYSGYSMQPACIINLSVFIIGYWIIREKRDYWLIPLIFISVWIRETTVLLILVYLFNRYDELPLKKLVAKTILFSFVFASGYLIIRNIYGYPNLYGTVDWAKSNLTNYRTYLYSFLIFSVFGWWGMQKINSKPIFLVRSLLMFPYFFVIHWFIGYLFEPRLFYPLLPIIIPLGLCTAFGTKKEYSDCETKNINSILTKYSKQFYMICFIIFLVLFGIYYQKTYSPYSEKHITTDRVKYAISLAEEGDIKKAKMEFDVLSKENPDNEDAQFNLGVFYKTCTKDYKKSIYHFQRYLDIAPNGKEAIKVKNQLKILKNK